MFALRKTGQQTLLRPNIHTIRVVFDRKARGIRLGKYRVRAATLFNNRLLNFARLQTENSRTVIDAQVLRLYHPVQLQRVHRTVVGERHEIVNSTFRQYELFAVRLRVLAQLPVTRQLVLEELALGRLQDPDRPRVVLGRHAGPVHRQVLVDLAALRHGDGTQGVATDHRRRQHRQHRRQIHRFVFVESVQGAHQRTVKKSSLVGSACVYKTRRTFVVACLKTRLARTGSPPQLQLLASAFASSDWSGSTVAADPDPPVLSRTDSPLHCCKTAGPADVLPFGSHRRDVVMPCVIYFYPNYFNFIS